MPGPPPTGSDFDALAGRTPDWDKGRRQGGKVGTLWRLTARASLVVPLGYVFPSLPLLDEAVPAYRNTLEAGTALRLFEVGADEDPMAAEMATFWLFFAGFFAGWGCWRFVIEDGPSSGVMVYLPSDIGPHGR